MPLNRRNFLFRLTAAAGTATFTPFLETVQGKSLIKSIQALDQQPLGQVIKDESFWYQIQQAYTVSTNILNLNNGGVSPQPKVVQEAVERYNALSNEAPSYYMWRVLDLGREPLRVKLAELAGCSPEELAINRNASEALETVIFGLRLKAGDEVVLSKQDYPNMINAWKQRAHRDGVSLKWVSVDYPTEDKQAIIDAYVSTFSANTKVVHITHMVNWNGQILPVKEIAQAAKSRGIQVLVDAAHTFAHLDYKISDLDCDYWGTSLHKWLCAPFGSGLLYVKKEHISQLYPLFASDNPEEDNIRKFERLGTRSFAIEQAVGQAIEFHYMIGVARKEQRLHYLKTYWLEQVMDLPDLQVNTSLHPDFSCAIANINIGDQEPSKLAITLFRDYKIHVASINWENIKGIRITPNVYTTTKDLDRLVAALRNICA